MNAVNEEWNARIESLVGSGPQHQVGGWPALVQDALWGECEEGASAAETLVFDGAVAVAADPAEHWSLVIQIDTDEEVGWIWGDGGLLYFAARSPIEPEQLPLGSWCVAQSY